ncbi:prepilin-type N-terminal cleavage/methylation domain-containing protein [Candidatus Daviesbacteria bacterium]|nr:prepilin-type N-terminal cleavage/methylation domain-containing protein [Candidatus Daviesbacteria bacterium]
MKKSAQALAKGFTLVELLVVIAIIAILAVISWYFVNPLEINSRGRDVARLADLTSLQNAISLAVQEATGSAAEILCNGGATPCNGSSNSGTRSSDGTGWVKVNLSAQKTASVPTLPVDPINDAVKHYTYCSDGNAWEINTTLESQQQSGKAGGDGGNDPALYELGSSLSLIATSGGSCTY